MVTPRSGSEVLVRDAPPLPQLCRFCTDSMILHEMSLLLLLNACFVHRSLCWATPAL